MAKAIVDRDREEIVDLVERYGRYRWSDNIGQLEELAAEIRLTRGILARFLDAAAEKGVFSEEELARIILDR